MVLEARPRAVDRFAVCGKMRAGAIIIIDADESEGVESTKATAAHFQEADDQTPVSTAAAGLPRDELRRRHCSGAKKGWLAKSSRGNLQTMETKWNDLRAIVLVILIFLLLDALLRLELLHRSPLVVVATASRSSGAALALGGRLFLDSGLLAAAGSLGDGRSGAVARGALALLLLLAELLEVLPVF